MNSTGIRGCRGNRYSGCARFLLYSKCTATPPSPAIHVCTNAVAPVPGRCNTRCRKAGDAGHAGESVEMTEVEGHVMVCVRSRTRNAEVQRRMENGYGRGTLRPLPQRNVRGECGGGGSGPKTAPGGSSFASRRANFPQALPGVHGKQYIKMWSGRCWRHAQPPRGAARRPSFRLVGGEV